MSEHAAPASERREWPGVSKGVRPRGRPGRDGALDELWARLASGSEEGRFNPACVKALPAPAARYLCRAITPGAPLYRSATLRMHGAIRLKPGAAPFAMRAEQVIAPPHGFVWKARVHRGPLFISGFDRYADGRGEMSWRLFGALRVMHADDDDVRLSAAGRLAGESILVPAALLPQFGTEWEDVDEQRALFRMRIDGEQVETTLTVDAVGRLQRVSIQRWRGAAGATPAGYDRFVVDGWAAERPFGGYLLPTQFRAGWRLGEPDEFPFFQATLDTVRWSGRAEPDAR